MKYNKTFEDFIKEGSLLNGRTELTYDDAIYFTKLDREIKGYYARVYPAEPKYRVIGQYGRDMSRATLKRLLTFAKKKNDKNLVDLVSRYLFEVESFVKDPELHRNARKYNL